MVDQSLKGIGQALEGVPRFFLERLKDGGGFGATPRLPATIEDTYYALRSLTLLKAMDIFVPEELFWGHGPFLKARLKEGAFGMGNLYRLLWSMIGLDTMGKEGLSKEVSPGRIARLIGARLGEGLEDLYYLRRIEELFANAGPGPTAGLAAGMTKGVRGPALPVLGPSSVKGLNQARLYIYLRQHPAGEGLGRGERQEWISWLRACQNHDGGFGFMPGTTSFMENCWYGLHALALLGQGPPDPQGLCDFIVSARSARGGFGRKNLGVPFPESTWHASASLSLLSGYSSIL